MEKVISLFCLLTTLISAVRVESLRCSNGERPYPPNICINLSTETTSANTITCNSKLVTFEDNEQFNTLSRYVELYDQNYWTGYRYNDGDTLVDSDDIPPSPGSPVLESNNFAADQPAPGAGICLFIGVDGINGVRLFRQDCSMELRYICAESVPAPSIISLTTSVSRFLSMGSPITLTCNAMNNDGPIAWRRNSSEVSSATPGLVISGDTLTVSSYDGTRTSYECVAGSRLGGVVSQAVVLTTEADSSAPVNNITQLSSAPPTPVQFGTSVTLTCSFTSTSTESTVEWFISGVLVFTDNVASGSTEASYIVEMFSQDGIYQCRVFNENGDNSIESLFISGEAGTPGLVMSPIFALADSPSQIFVSWLYPSELNVLDPVLLRYEVHYQVGTNFDEGTAIVKPRILPVQLDGQVSDGEVIETTLVGLSPGTTFTVTVRAVSTHSSGGLGGGTVIVSTFGNVPDISVEDSLKVQRTTDNKTLFADWSDVKTALPVGQVARYWVDYRDSDKDDAINTALLDPKFSYFVVSPVQDAQNYQVRVRIGVIVGREPLTYGYGPFTKWVQVQGVTNTVPPVPPTQPILPASSIIAAAVVVPALILALIVFVIIFGAICYCMKSGRKDNYSPRQRIDSQAVDLRPKEQLDVQELPLEPTI